MTQIHFLNRRNLMRRRGRLYSHVQALWAQLDPKSPRPSRSAPRAPGDFTFLEAHPGNIYAVMQDDRGKILAAATVIFIRVSQKSCIQIEDFIVHPAHRGQGHGRELLAALVEHFDNGGVYFFAHMEIHPSRMEMIELVKAMHFSCEAAATTTRDGSVHVFRHNFFDPET